MKPFETTCNAKNRDGPVSDMCEKDLNATKQL